MSIVHLKARARVALGVMAAVVAVAVCTPTAASAISAAKALGLLNHQRAANGIPRGLTIEGRQTQGCQEHVAYLQRNPDEYNRNPHNENPGLPGYTHLGQGVAGHSELAPENYWTDIANPFDAGTFGPYPTSYAPLHEFRLLDPANTIAWYADAPRPSDYAYSAYTCIGAAGERTFRGARFFSFPGDGRTRVVRALWAYSEQPASPAMLVGIKRSELTGPNIMVWAEGAAADAHITRMTLRSAHGQEPIRRVDAGTRYYGTQELNAGSAIIVPTRELDAGTKYTLTLTWKRGRVHRWTQRVRFTTRTEPKQ